MAPEDTTTIKARPYPLAIVPQETAVIVVDMQQGFFGVGGAWDQAGVDVSGVAATVRPTAHVLAAARQAGILVVYLVMDFEGGQGRDERLWNAERAAHWLSFVGGGGSPLPHTRQLPPGVKNSDILPELAPQPHDVLVVKPDHSGFYNTNLHALLQEKGITTLVFTGGTTSVCVESTLRDAYFREYACLLLADCTAEPIGNHLPRTNREATFLLIEAVYGWVGESSAFVQALTEKVTASDAAVMPA